MRLPAVLCAYFLVHIFAVSEMKGVDAEPPSKTHSESMKNVYRFSSSDQQTKNRPGSPTMQAILMECPKEPFIKGDTSNALCEEKISVNIRMSSKQSNVSWIMVVYFILAAYMNV